MKTAISIPDRDFRNAERLAKKLGISRSELYTQAVRQFISSRDRSELTRQMNAALDKLTAEETELDPVLKQMQSKVFRGETW